MDVCNILSHAFSFMYCPTSLVVVTSCSSEHHRVGATFTDADAVHVRRGRVPPNVHFLLSSSLSALPKTMHPSSPLIPASSFLDSCSNYAQSQGLNRKQPWLVCASAVIKRGAKKGINDLIEEEKKKGDHTDSGTA